MFSYQLHCFLLMIYLEWVEESAEHWRRNKILWEVPLHPYYIQGVQEEEKVPEELKRFTTQDFLSLRRRLVFNA